MPTYTASAPAPDTHSTVPVPRWRPDSPPHRRLYSTSAILGGAGALILAVYITSATEMYAEASTLLACLIAALITLAGVSLIAGYSVRTRADEAQALRSQACMTAASVAEQLELVSTRLARLEGADWERLDRIECRLNEHDEEYERGWVDGAARAAEAVAPPNGNGNGNGAVRQLRPTPPAPPRRPGR